MNINLTLIAQALSFALFILFTVKFIWPPLMKAIEERQKQIADGLAAGEQGKQQLEASGRRANEEIGKARERAAEIVAHAEQRATQMIEAAKNAAKEEGEREKAAAKAEIAQEASRAREALREHVAALAMSGAERILQREVDARAHAELLTQLKHEL
jgi:F-type H+-transporting ATPase subunit b